VDLTARRVDRVINRDTTGIECIKLDGSHLDGLHSARLEHRTTPVVGIVASTEGPVSWPPTTTHHSGGGQPRCWKVRELPHTSEVRYRLCVTSGSSTSTVQPTSDNHRSCRSVNRTGIWPGFGSGGWPAVCIVLLGAGFMGRPCLSG